MSMLLLSLLFCSGVSVTLPAEARVHGAEIRLGEIAEVVGDDPAEVARVRALELGYAPSPGYSRLLARWKIESQAAEALPSIALTFAGESSVRVQVAVRELEAQRIEEAARTALMRRLAGTSVELVLVEPVQPMIVPQGDTELVLEAEVPSHDLAAGRFTVAVRVRIDGALYRTVWTSWQVELTRSLPVLVRDVPSGAPIGPDAVRFEERRLESPLAGAPIDAALLVGTVAARPLGAGAVLLERDVRRVLLVRQNEQVQLEILRGPIVARTGAVARQSGHHGSIVRVQVPGTGRELTARVVGENLVQVVLGGAQ